MTLARSIPSPERIADISLREILSALKASVEGLDREGQLICTGHVVKVLNPKGFDRTPVVTVAVPQGCAMSVRNIALRKQG